MFEPSDRKVVKRTGPRTARVLNLNGRLPAPVEAESSLERDFLRRAVLNPQIAEIVHQPYRVSLTAGHYTPDFLLRWKSGARDVVEVKIRKKIKDYRAVFDEVATMVADRGGRFLVADEFLIREGGAHSRAALVLRYLKGAACPKR